MDAIQQALREHGLALVFVNVFLEQVGVPLPAIPTLVVAGAMVHHGHLDGWAVTAALLAGSLASDVIWYAIGRRHGQRALNALCRLSLSPASCVRRTEGVYERWGLWSIVLAKLVPGYSTLAPPLAGALRMRPATFLAASAVSALLWGGVAVAAGAAFADTVDDALDWLDGLGAAAFGLLVGLLVVYLCGRWVRQHAFVRSLRMVRVTPLQLRALLDGPEPPLVLDVRSALQRADDPRRVPGSRVLDLDDVDAALRDEPLDRDVVLTCA